MSKPAEELIRHVISVIDAFGVGNDAVKASKSDRINRIDRMEKQIRVNKTASPIGDSFWIGIPSCSSCKSCLNLCLSRFSVCTVPAKIE
jgi:hypothetical protein